MIRACAVLLAATVPAFAEDQEVVIRVENGIVAEQGAVLRGLDRIRSTVTDFDIAPGQTIEYERLKVTLETCKYPEGKEQVEGFAYLTISDIRQDGTVFEGWMFASSPALSALDHPRYDIWVLRCKT